MKRIFVFALTVSLLAVGSSFAVMDGLVGAWLFDEGAGKVAGDSSGNGHDGELVGNAEWEDGGVFGSAVSTDGTEAYVMIPDHEDLEFDGDFSIACWVQNELPPPDHSSFVTKGYHRPSGNGGDARPWYLMYFLTGGTVDMFLRDLAGTNSRAVGATPVNDGEWHHIVGVKDGNEVRIYIDGEADGAAPAVDATYGENDQPLVFMVHFDRWFPGMIDEVAIFNRALTENEIEQVMDGLAPNVLSVEPVGKLAVTWGGLKENR